MDCKEIALTAVNIRGKVFQFNTSKAVNVLKLKCALNPREEIIMDLLFVQYKKIKEAATITGYSATRIHQIRNKCCAKLFKAYLKHMEQE